MTDMPGTQQRVMLNTDEQINKRNRRELEARICYFSQRLDQIQQRLDELESEWDIERTLQANAAAVSLLGVFLGATACRKWFLLPGVIAAFLMQHAIQGWCPPLPIFRKLGIRTAKEINQEKVALKALRGDFDQVNSQVEQLPQEKASKALEAASAC